MTTWKSRHTEDSTIWHDIDRYEHLTKSRKYMLGSFFTQILTAITDPKDGKALKIKCDPSYYINPEYKEREQVTDTVWKTTRFN